MSIIKINDINFNSLYFFYVVYQKNSMTKAAEYLHATQSGVSQRILQLEKNLEITLFNRSNGKLFPTEMADNLFQILQQTFFNLEKSLSEGLENSIELKGELRIGIPIEFGNRYILPLVSKFIKIHPNINFKIEYGHALLLKEKLKNQSLYFAIVDDYPFDKIEFNKTPLAKENLVLCGHKDYSMPLNKQTYNQLKILPYIDHNDEATFIKQWFKQNFKIKSLKIPLKISAMDVQGVATLISEGAGVGILSETMAKEKNFFIFKENKKGLINQMSIVELKQNKNKLSAAFKQFIMDQIEVI